MLTFYQTTKLIRLFFVLLASLILEGSTAVGQTTNKTLSFNTLTINDGLSQGMVLRMFQDRFGFMWFATLDGLNRYDGYHFNVYRHDARDTSSITESYVTSFFEDSRGRLWLGTISGGLDLFNPETETFDHIKHQNGNSNSLSQGPINSISEDKHGNLWINLTNKIDKLVFTNSGANATFSIHHVKVPLNSETSFLTTGKTGEVLYVNAKDGVIYRLSNETTEEWLVVLKLDDYIQKDNRQNKGGIRILQLLEDKVQAKFYIFHPDGVIRVDERTTRPEKFYSNQLFKNTHQPSAGSLDKNGIAWFPTLPTLSCFNTNTGAVDNVSAKDPALSQALTSTYSTFIDRSGLLWIGTAGYGIMKRNTRAENFHHTGNSSDYSIKETDDSKIIIGNNSQIKKVFDKAKGELVNATVKENKAYSKILFAPIASDRTGFWFADTGKFSYYNSSLKQYTYYPLPITANAEYPNLIHCKIKDCGGNIWLGTTMGLLRFNIAEKKWRVYKNNPNDSTSIASNLIFSLCLDLLQPQKYMWIGTGGSGLNRMDLVTGKCISYSINDGLPNNVIYGILNDDDGRLWMSTNKGLSCFDMQRRTFRNFDYNDGLQSNEFNRGAYCRTKDGCLFFGGVNGFNYFYPLQITNNFTVPQIVITGLKIRNAPVSLQTVGSPLIKAIYLTKNLTLRYDQNVVSFEFASMDFTNSEKNLYQYKLEGIDKEWINSDNTRSATYTNLNPGTYTFKARGSNNDGIWNEKGTSLQLIILPPWYMTWWFRTAIAMGIIMAIYAFYHYQLSHALKLQFIRDRIAADLHDEVGSNLSNIFIFSNVAQQKLKINREAGDLLQKIKDYTQQSMEAMDDIVWMINTHNDRFENIMVRMRILAAELSDTLDCELHLEFDESLTDIHLNMEDRKNFYLIYKEAINNTSKYAECKNVWIELRLHQKMIKLEIKDNGRGFDTANGINGNGIINMKKRAEMLNGSLTVESAIGEGTILQLNFKV